MTLRFPDAPGTTRTLDDCNRAIKFIQSSQALTVPAFAALPATGEMGQVAVLDEGGPTSMWWWSGSAWTAMGSGGGGGGATTGGLDGGGP